MEGTETHTHTQEIDRKKEEADLAPGERKMKENTRL